MILRRKDKKNIPINEAGLASYMHENYIDFVAVEEETYTLPHYQFVAQQDYGKGEQNCSLTSIMAAANYLDAGSTPDEIYKYVRELGGLFLYTPRVIGTISLFIGIMYSIVKHHFLEKNSYIKTGRGYIKGVGFSYSKICRALRSGRPIILSMLTDGRGVYKSHTVTVMGYKEYRNRRTKLQFLVLNDNWSREPRYLDFKKMSIISSIYY